MPFSAQSPHSECLPQPVRDLRGSDDGTCRRCSGIRLSDMLEPLLHSNELELLGREIHGPPDGFVSSASRWLAAALTASRVALCRSQRFAPQVASAADVLAFCAVASSTFRAAALTWLIISFLLLHVRFLAACLDLVSQLMLGLRTFHLLGQLRNGIPGGLVPFAALRLSPASLRCDVATDLSRVANRLTSSSTSFNCASSPRLLLGSLGRLACEPVQSGPPSPFLCP